MDDLGEYVQGVIDKGVREAEEQARKFTGTRSGRKKRRMIREQRYLDHAKKYMRSVGPAKQREFIQALREGQTVQPETGLERTPTGLFKRIRKDVSALIRGLVK